MDPKVHPDSYVHDRTTPLRPAVEVPDEITLARVDVETIWYALQNESEVFLDAIKDEHKKNVGRLEMDTDYESLGVQYSMLGKIYAAMTSIQYAMGEGWTP